MPDRKKNRITKTSRPKELLFWIGGIAAAIASLIAIYEKVAATGPARLTVVFSESESPRLNLVPPVNTASELTEELPFQLKIDNVGGKASGNTKLYLAYNNDLLEITTDYSHERKTILRKSNEILHQLALKVENINPGESYLIPLKIRLRIDPAFQEMTVRPANAITKQEASKRMAFRIFADLSSDTIANTRSELEIVVGRCDVLQEDGSDVFWVGHGDKGILLLKVRSDYPCR
jgi:hypothetical protein